MKRAGQVPGGAAGGRCKNTAAAPQARSHPIGSPRVYDVKLRAVRVRSRSRNGERCQADLDLLRALDGHQNGLIEDSEFLASVVAEQSTLTDGKMQADFSYMDSDSVGD